ncbi:MAG: YdbH domain-containing protein, partial [Gammaproteobacteria bacterium]|nr:YdbH domain-containing protein [Gammaproteobacteria bacterium]
MPRPVKFVLVILLILALALMVVLVWPLLFISPLVTFYLNEAGVQLEAMAGLDISWEGAHLEQLVISNSSMQLTARDLSATFTIVELSQRRIQSVTIPVLEIAMLETKQQSVSIDTPPTLNAVLQAIESVAVDSIQLDEVALLIGSDRAMLQMNLQTQPVEVRGNASLARLPETSLQFEIRRGDPGGLSGHVALHSDNQDVTNALMRVDVNAAFEEQSLELIIDSTISLESLSAVSLPIEPMNLVEFASDAVTLNAALSLEEPLGNLSLRGVDLSFDNQAHEVQWSLLMDTGPAAVQTALPISIQGKLNELNPVFEISSPQLLSRITLRSENLITELDIQLNDATLNCGSPSQCFGETILNAQVNTLRSDSFSADGITLEGRTNLEYTDQYAILSAANLALLGPNVSSNELQGSLDLSLENLNIILGDVIRGQMSFRSNAMLIDVGGLKPRNPTVSGLLNFFEDHLAGTAELTLNNQLSLNGNFNHHLVDNSGRAEIEAPAYAFSELTPLSGLLEQSLVTGDILGGSVAGRAEIRWDQDDTGAWQFAGPLTLALDNISGFVDDTFFVGLQTEVFAEVVPPLSIRSSDELLASLATIDVGLSVRNVTWRYGFNSANQEIRFHELASEVLGGLVSIPQFNYSGLRDTNDLAVVLSDMDLNTIVELAEYPELYVDGAISGYLPISLQGGKLMIEQGLVAALNPGGTIRYTPANP